MIELTAITYRYPSQSPSALPVFEDFSWRAAQGEAWAVIGNSGCGKTTLLYLLAGLRFPERGCIRIHDELLTRPRPQTGLILQDYGLLPWATVSQNAALGLQVRDFYGPDGTHAPRQAAAATNIDTWLERLA
jgi:ABC-type nitrate/sulfonate/bicarbonate transport system ATPase subunit